MRATYRLQLGPSLTFDDVRARLDYYERLGISHLYLSPMWKARTGSAHGYDVVDPTRLNPTLGDFEALASAVHARGLGIIADIVPNHMAASRENDWWWDVLRHGRDSEFARVFDIDWDRGGGKVVLPLGEVPETGEFVRDSWTNYRRFFDIDDLVAVRVEDPWVFGLTHSMILSLVSSGLVAGLRVDHVDGLRDPAGYLRRLRSRMPSGCLLYVEKILRRDEELPRDWPVDGTTGYEFIDHADGLFVDRGGMRAGGFARVAEAAKREVVTELFAHEVDALSELLGGAREAIVEMTVALDVYRTYGTIDGFSPTDRRRIRAAADRARRRVRDRAALDSFVRFLLTQRRSQAWLDVVARWQQLTGPAMAKGTEDTALYRFPRLTSRNEVGCEPGRPVVSVDQFHTFNASRARRRPIALNAGSTHDTKRGEDVRARINVLSEIGDEWEEWTSRWVRPSPPSEDDQQLFLQTVVGAWPIDAERMWGAIRKSIREAKVQTSWRNPDEAYERSVEAYVRMMLGDAKFVADVVAMLKRVSVPALVNSLAGVVLRAASPGAPDVYQGSESIYLRLVDPDNREAVEPVELPSSLPALSDPSVKTFVLMRALGVRVAGSYEPIAVHGRLRRHVVAFARRDGREWTIACVPRLVARLTERGRFPLGEVWRGTRLALPPRAPNRWRNVLTDEVIRALDVPDLFHMLPVALLVST